MFTRLIRYFDYDTYKQRQDGRRQVRDVYRLAKVVEGLITVGVLYEFYERYLKQFGIDLAVFSKIQLSMTLGEVKKEMVT